MAIIDPSGLFNGDRLRRCSNAAQLHWPRLFLASDGFGRLEINFARIVGKAYSTFCPVPSDTEMQALIQEYVDNSLLFLYEVNGQVWGAWDTKSEWLPRYKTAADQRSPIPPEPSFTEWKQRYRAEQKAFPKPFHNVAETFLNGVGVGGGVGINTCSPHGEQKSTLSSDVTRPANQDELPRRPVRESQAKSWGSPEKRRSFLDRFWPLWPRKVAKAAAEKAWCREATSPEQAEKIIKAARAQLPRLSADLKFCPHATTWLNQKRYEDEVEETGAVEDQSSLYTPAEENE